MIKKTITIENKLGLHARAAVKFVNMANRFSSSVKIIKDDSEIDGKSVLGILTLAAVKGSQITMKVSGEDEKAAMENLKALVENKFQEEE